MRYQSPYKSSESQQDTRYATTSKKVRIRQPIEIVQQQGNSRQQHQRGNYQLQALYSQKQRLKTSKQKQLDKNKFRAASATDHKIRKINTEIKIQQVRKLSYDHYIEKTNIKKLHLNEMKHLKKAWQDVFQNLQEQKRSTLARFKRDQLEELEMVRYKLRKKYHSLRSTNRDILDLSKQQYGLRKQNRIEDMRYIHRQKKLQINKMNRRRMQQFQRMVQAEQKKFKVNQTKRYNSLMMKLEENKYDYKNHYNRQKMRFKQKYKNVLSLLNHEQQLEMNELLSNNIFQNFE